MGGKTIYVQVISQSVPRGQSSSEGEFGLIPDKKGNMELEFLIEGKFFLVGSETILDHNSAFLGGTVVRKKILEIK